MRIRLLAEEADILPILEQDRLYAAYAIGDLVTDLSHLCRFAVAENGSEASALAMTFEGLHPPVLFVMGQAAGVRSILADSVTPSEAHFTMRPEHLRAATAEFQLADIRRMYRMSVTRESFRPVVAKTRRLQSTDISALNALYAWGGMDFFAGYQLDQGVYRVVEIEGRMVAAAGTHVVAPDYGIAAVGNVYTHPDYRNRGFATACTGAVTADLLDMGCRWVVLNVRQSNAPAVSAYTKLGYAVHCPFLETPGRRKPAIKRVVQRFLH
jgi:ribosomal protein S18 acetylase RimI-like enzyme